MKNYITLIFLTFSFTVTTARSVAIVNLRIADAVVVEGNSGQRTIEVLVVLSQSATDPFSVRFSSRNGSASAGSDYILNSGTLNFSKGEMMKRITVYILGELAVESDETLEVILHGERGISMIDSVGTVTILNDDFNVNNTFSVYEVRLTFKGYTSLAGEDIGNCPIRSNGMVVLSGLLYADESPGSSDDIDYTGAMQLDIDMDICSAKTVEDAGGGYPQCGLTVIGSGPVKTDLKIHYDGRGGYITTEDQTGHFTKSVNGTCDPGQIGEELAIVPNGSIASVFNGLDLPELTQRTLPVGQYQQSDGRNVIVFEVKKIR